MASVWTLSSPIFVSNSLQTTSRNVVVACNKRLYSPRSKLSDVTTKETTIRRSANYQPTLWSNDFIRSLSSKYTGEKYRTKLQTLKDKVRTMICEENGTVEDILNFIDDLQRLGISYHFVNEISNILENIYCNYYKSHENWKNLDLNVKSLGFRLLRQHGYHIPQEIFVNERDENGNFKGEDIIDMLNLYEASYYSLPDEQILDDARDFTTIYLKESLAKIVDQNMLSLISHSLKFPLNWMVPRVGIRWYIEAYERRSNMNPLVLELAKLDFNVVQVVHQEELNISSKWWSDISWEKYGFFRDRLAENYMWTVGASYFPHFKGRIDVTKVFAIITTIDDVYDVYGTLNELEKFTEIVNSWDLNGAEELPDYMKVCFLAWYNTTNELLYDTLKNKGAFVLPYLKKTWKDQCDAYLTEAKWFNDGYTPTFTEFINNAYMSVGTVAVIRHTYLVTLSSVTEESLQRIERARDLIRYASLIVRLINDITTSSDEMARGDVPKSIQCYMRESGANEVEARAYIKQLIIETWKKLNKERQAIRSELPHEFIECVINHTRMAHFMYIDGDKHGKPELFKPYVLSLFVNPV